MTAHITSFRGLAWFLAVVLIATAFFSFVSGAAAQQNVSFPVKELGGCNSKEACHAYCEESRNMAACLSFAEKNGLMSERELSDARKFMAAGGKGPGDCTTKASCEAFCNNVSNISACIAFAEKNGMMSGDELKEAKKVMKALEAGVAFPGGCRSREECDAYCGGSDPSHMKECIMFAKAAGLMSDEEAREVDKVLSALEKGVKPPKCRGDEECAMYCSQEKNIEECAAFMSASGMATEEEIALFRKTGGRGPGGCLGRECETFCDNPANNEVCAVYARENDDAPESGGKGDEGRDRFRSDFEKMPASVRRCLQNSIGAELDKMLRGNPPSSEAAVKMRACFEQMRPPVSESQSIPPSDGYGSEGYTLPPESYIRPGSEVRISPPMLPQEGTITPTPTSTESYIPVPATGTPAPLFPEGGTNTNTSTPPPIIEPVSVSPGQAAAALLMVFFGMLR